MKFAILTVVEMCRLKLVTTETMVSHHDENYCDYEDSVNDDLDFFYEGLKLGLVCNESIKTFCFPKLTANEMKLMKMRDEDHLNSYAVYFEGGVDGGEDFSREDPDVDESEMKQSESKSKYVDVLCHRATYVIQNRPRKYSDHESDETEEK